jgi:thioredoxin reductase
MNIKRIVILGAGSAGLLAALTLRRRTRLDVEIIRSTDIGVIGVGEGRKLRQATEREPGGNGQSLFEKIATIHSVPLYII